MIDLTNSHQNTFYMYSIPCAHEDFSFFIYSPKVHSLVMSELSVGHVTMISNDLPHMFWWHVFLLGFHKSKLSFFSIAFGLQLLPLASYNVKKKKTQLTFTINFNKKATEGLIAKLQHFTYHCITLLLQSKGVHIPESLPRNCLLLTSDSSLSY